MKIKDSHHLYAALTIVFWSFAYVLTRLTLQYFSPFSLGFLRYFIASAALLVIFFVTKMKLPQKKDLLWFLASGAVGFFLYMIVFNLGQSYVTASTASVVIATVPVITALMARFIYHEELQHYKWVAILIEFSGVAVLTLMNSSFSLNTGLFWLMGAALALSAYNIIQRKLTKSYSALQTSIFSIFFGTLMLAVFSPRAFSELSAAPAVQYLYLAILGIFSSAIAYVSWTKAFSLAKHTSQVSNYMFITPFLASILGFIIAHEIPDTPTIIGGCIILLGLVIFNFGSKFFQKKSSE